MKLFADQDRVGFSDEGALHLAVVKVGPADLRPGFAIEELIERGYSLRAINPNREKVAEIRPAKELAQSLKTKEAQITDLLDELEELLNEFGLQNIRKTRGDLLSGGERRRTEIARALATKPKFILLDEPFAGVDPIAVEDIQSIVEGLKEKNIGILITDHNVQETLAITDRTYLMFEGKILKSGTAEELAADKQVRKVYLGQNFELRARK